MTPTARGVCGSATPADQTGQLLLARPPGGAGGTEPPSLGPGFAGAAVRKGSRRRRGPPAPFESAMVERQDGTKRVLVETTVDPPGPGSSPLGTK